ncbi:MAG: hypothetical protein VCD00_03600 [Candidatus Hydrogenedentota bacterium]
MTDLYILDGDNKPIPMPESDLVPWGLWLDDAKASGRSVVGDDTLERFHVRTVFGGCDNNWDGGTPVLFETRVTEGGERRDLFLRRYESWQEAESGHSEVCTNIRNDIAGGD